MTMKGHDRSAKALRFVGAISAAFVLGSCRQGIPVGSTMYVGEGGAPLCDTSERLQLFLRALQENDSDWIQSLSEACRIVPEGTKIVILADLPKSIVGEAVKIRAFEDDTTSDGYSVTLGYRPSP